MLTHAGRGQAAIGGNHSHIYRDEAGGASILGNVPMHMVPTRSDGMLELDKVTGRCTVDHRTKSTKGSSYLEVLFVWVKRDESMKHCQVISEMSRDWPGQSNAIALCLREIY